MNPTTAAITRALARAAKPWTLLAGVLLYALGGGIARYLGNFIDWPVYFTGQAALTMLQLSASFLREYFDRATQPPFEQVARRDYLSRHRPPTPPPAPASPPSDPAPGAEPPEPEVVEILIPRVIFFQAAAATLTIGAVMTVLLVAEGRLAPATLLFLGLAVLLALAYAIPPLRLVYSGYGELAMAVLLANLFPSLAFLLQTGSLHRLLAMLTFPLALIYLAAELARELRGYFADTKANRQTMLVRLGWQRGMALHNALVAAAFIALSIAAIAGLPWRLTYPAFLALPIGIFQIWQMNRIAAGAPPTWRVLDYTALASVGMMAYFLALALWIG